MCGFKFKVQGLTPELVVDASPAIDSSIATRQSAPCPPPAEADDSYCVEPVLITQLADLRLTVKAK